MIVRRPRLASPATVAGCMAVLAAGTLRAADPESAPAAPPPRATA
jgi:hypothetical protein